MAETAIAVAKNKTHRKLKAHPSAIVRLFRILDSKRAFSP
jgi:hypothetical protein